MVWGDFKLDHKYDKYRDRVLNHDEFLRFEVTSDLLDQLEQRIKAQSPGHCVSLV